MHEEENYKSMIKTYKQIFYAPPMELAKELLFEQQKAAMTIQAPDFNNRIG